MHYSLGTTYQSFSLRERIAFLTACAIFVISGTFLAIHTIRNITLSVPREGGSYTEGVVGQPAFINPILTKDGTPDKALVKLLFANIPTLAESIKNSDDFRVWTVRIKEAAQWQDKSPITSDDIIYTIQTIQDPDTLSPLNAEWQNITATRVSEREIRFELLDSYALFENLLVNLYPVPKKLFAELSPATMKLSAYNLEPIGSGPFVYESYEKRKSGFIESFTVTASESYESIGITPYIYRLTMHFFPNEEEMVRAYNVGIIDGFGTHDWQMAKNLKINATIQKIETTKFYAAFFNTSANDALTSRAVRKVLTHAIDKTALVRDLFDGSAVALNGPIPQSVHGFDPVVNQYYTYNPDQARKLLTEDGWKFNDEEGVWEKGSAPLKITVKTPNLWPLKDIAQRIKRDWEAIGISVSVQTIDPQIITDEVIRTRNYEVLLFGNTVSYDPDPFTFWHSSERFYPGLNLSLYQNADIDKLILKMRKAGLESGNRDDLLAQFQEKVANDYPALFLVSPDFLYITKSTIPGITIDPITMPHDRMNNITDWYLATRRIFSK